MVGMTTVFFEGLEFYAYHGVPPEEQKIGHRYTADLYLVLAKEPSGDSLNSTVDYGDAMKAVIAFATERQYKTVEALASALANDLMSRYSLVKELTLRIAKVSPPAPFIVSHAGVEVTRSR